MKIVKANTDKNVTKYSFVSDKDSDRMWLRYNDQGTYTTIHLCDFELDLQFLESNYPEYSLISASLLIKDVAYSHIISLNEYPIIHITLSWFTSDSEQVHDNTLLLKDCFSVERQITALDGGVPKFEYDNVNARFVFHVNSVSKSGEDTKKIKFPIFIPNLRGKNDIAVAIDDAGFRLSPVEIATTSVSDSTDVSVSGSFAEFVNTSVSVSDAHTTFTTTFTDNSSAEAVIQSTVSENTKDVFIPHHTIANSRDFDVKGRLEKLERKYKTDYGRTTIEALQFFLNEDQRKLCKEFLDYHGSDVQFLKTAEEAAELSSEIVKSSLYPDSREYREAVFKEIADLTMLLYQISIAFKDDWQKLLDEHLGNKFIKADLTLQKNKAEKKLKALNEAAVKYMDKIFDAEFELGEIQAVLDHLADK